MEDNLYSDSTLIQNDTANEPYGGLALSVQTVQAKRGVNIPGGVPRSVESAIADIDEGEREFEKGQTYTHKEVLEMVWNRISSYAS